MDPERSNFLELISYDNDESFQKIKQPKEKEELGNLPAQDEFNTDIRLMTIEPIRKEDSTKHSVDGLRNDKTLQKRKSLLNLTRASLQCPINVCKRTIGGTLILSHFLRDHSRDFGISCQEIYLGTRSVLEFNPINFNFGENICLGILAYGGDTNQNSSRPNERGPCAGNIFLPPPYEHLENHLPILIMACRTSWSSFSGIKWKEANLQNLKPVEQELLVIWLTSAQLVKPLHCTVTVYDKSMSTSRSRIMQIRSLSDTQNPEEFMPKETNFMHLSHGEINILTQSRTEATQMEILINEY